MSDIHILLLGETGVGKSTFINAIPNYLEYRSLNDAERNFIQLIPMSVELNTEDDNPTIVSTGTHANEIEQIGSLATRNPKIHKISYGGRNIKIIDTPGIGDSRGIGFDELNVKKIYKVLEKFQYLNTICVMLKPTNSRLDTFFNYCIRNILSQFNTELRTNIIYLFTNSRGTHFKPGDTSQILKTALRQMESSEIVIPFKKENTFCVDNETIRYLAARTQTVEFSDEEVTAFQNSWEVSSKECRRLLNYSMTLRPSSVQIIVSLRDSRMVIAKLAMPLVEIMVLHEKSLGRIKNHKDEIKDRQNSIEDLKSRLYIPIIQYKCTKKIITDSKTGTKVNVGGFFNQMGLGIGGNVKYRDTTKTHTEEYIEPYEIKVEDVNVNRMLKNEQDRLEFVKEKLEQLETIQNEYDQELNVIVEAAGKFVIFLNENTHVGHQHEDPFQLYIEQILAEERNCNGPMLLINNLESLLTRYKLNKRRNRIFNVTAEDVQNAIGSLLRLNHAGPQFRQLYNQILD